MYCTRCGKKLEEGEVCTCRQNDAVKMQPQAQMPKQTSAPQQQTPKQPSTPQQQMPKETVTSKIQMPGQAAASQPKVQISKQATAQPQHQAQNPTYQQAQRQATAQNPNYQQNVNRQQNPNYQQNVNRQQNPNYQQNVNYQQNPNYQQNMNYQQNYQSANRMGNAQNQADWVKAKGNVAAENAKSFLQSIVQILKKPASETVRMTEEGAGKEGIRFIIAKGIVLIVVALIMAARLGSEWDTRMPYEGLIVFMLLFTIGIDFVEAFLLKAFTSAFKGVTTIDSMYIVIGIRDVYDMIIALVTLILSLVSSSLAACVCGLAVMFLPCIQYSLYRVAIHADENKKAYAFSVAKICVVVIMAILMFFVGVSLLGFVGTSLLGSLGNIFNTSSYYGW